MSGSIECKRSAQRSESYTAADDRKFQGPHFQRGLSTRFPPGALDLAFIGIEVEPQPAQRVVYIAKHVTKDPLRPRNQRRVVSEHDKTETIGITGIAPNDGPAPETFPLPLQTAHGPTQCASE